MQLKDFPLAWRWTDENYALLPEDILARIVPQTKEQAALLFNKSLEFFGADGLNGNKYSVSQLSTREVEPEQVSAWLFAHYSNLDTPVVLSWQPSIAVTTTWDVFVRYWNEFCYPASDDVSVWSESQTWVLLYHHEEFFQFGERV